MARWPGTRCGRRSAIWRWRADRLIRDASGTGGAGLHPRAAGSICRGGGGNQSRYQDGDGPRCGAGADAGLGPRHVSSEAICGMAAAGHRHRKCRRARRRPRPDLPPSPHFRLVKEIKNVVTVIAKGCHYWQDHMLWTQQLAIGRLFNELAGRVAPRGSGPLARGARGRHARESVAHLAETIRRDTGLPPSTHGYRGWLGVDCPTVRAAVWMMRLMLASNILHDGRSARCSCR